MNSITKPWGYWQQIQNHKRFLQSLGEKLRVHTFDGWYKLHGETIIRHGGKCLVNTYGGSFKKCLKAVFPHREWSDWKFEYAKSRKIQFYENTIQVRKPTSRQTCTRCAPLGYWAHQENHRIALDAIGKELGVKHLDDWYDVHIHDVQARGGAGLMNCYGNTLSLCLQKNYPQHTWQPWRHTYAPKGYWDREESRHCAIDFVGKDLGIKHLDDWYKITTTDFMPVGGALLNLYNNSISTCLESLYPNHGWCHWKFSYALENLAEQLQLYLMDDWYRITAEIVHKYGGGGLIDLYDSSLIHALADNYPSHEWKQWKFARSQTNFWSSIINQKKALDDIAREMKVKSIRAWESVTCETFRNNGGGGIINHYNGSITQCLKTIYPNYTWRQRRTEDRVAWRNVDTQTLFLECIKKHYSLAKPESWYRLSSCILVDWGGTGFLRYYHNALRRAYPGQVWDEERLVASTKKTKQWWLKAVLKKCFSDNVTLRIGTV